MVLKFLQEWGMFLNFTTALFWDVVRKMAVVFEETAVEDRKTSSQEFNSQQCQRKICWSRTVIFWQQVFPLAVVNAKIVVGCGKNPQTGF